MVEVQRNRRNVKWSSNAQIAEEMAAELSAVSNTGPDTRHVRYTYQTRPEIPDLLPDTSGNTGPATGHVRYAGQHKMTLREKSKTLANGIQKS
jgi:hypothetical protein